jgi:hypothetical protein
MRIAAMVVFVAVGSVHAESLKPGAYVTNTGWGNLTLKTGKGGALTFSLEAMGVNGHECSLEGELRGGKATLEGLDARQPCIVTMKATAEGIEVEGDRSGACSLYCGFRANFVGLYLRPPAGCEPHGIAASRRAFQRAYDTKDYARARTALQPLLDRCTNFMSWLEVGRVRNDLAVTLHKLRELSACREVLEPLALDAAESDAAIREQYPPTDADNYLPIVRSTRTNLRLCAER